MEQFLAIALFAVSLIVAFNLVSGLVAALIYVIVFGLVGALFELHALGTFFTTAAALAAAAVLVVCIYATYRGERWLFYHLRKSWSRPEQPPPPEYTQIPPPTAPEYTPTAPCNRKVL